MCKTKKRLLTFVMALAVCMTFTPLVASAAPPSSYDARSYGYITPDVKNQGSNELCWAFATYGAVESNMLKNGQGQQDFSELHMAYATSTASGNSAQGFSVRPTPDSQGGRLMAASYFMRGTNLSGTVAESADPYETAITSPYRSLSVTESKAKNFRVQNIVFLGGALGSISADDIKQAVLDYGSVVASMHWDTSSTIGFGPGGGLTSVLVYYNADNHAYYFPSGDSLSTGSTHTVLIIGWDDAYPANNFNADKRPSSNGAWLVKDSRGTDMNGADGCFWISYEDTQFPTNPFAIDGVRAYDPNETVYEHEYIWNNGAIRYSATQAYFARVFTANSADEALYEVKVAIPDPDVTVSVDVIPAFSDFSSYFASNAFTSKGGIQADYPGYYTIELNAPVQLGGAGSEFAVIVKMERASGGVAIGYGNGSPASGTAYRTTSAPTALVEPDPSELAGSNYCIKAVTLPSSGGGSGDTGDELTPTIIINAPNGFTFDDGTDFFEAYKIFSVTFDGDNYSYTLLPEFEDFDGYPTHDTQTLKEYLESHPDADAMTDLATELRSYIKNASPAIDAVGDVTVTDAQVTIDLEDAGYGYYLVFHSINAFDDEGAPVQIVATCALTTTDPVAKFKAKVDVPSLTKYIKLANGALVDTSAINLGNTVDFVLELTLPTTVEAYESYPLIVHDEIGISSTYFFGLDPEGTNGFIGNMTVKLIDPTNVLSPIVLTSLQYEATPAPDGFTIEFDYNEVLEILAIDDNADYYTTILIEYSAVVNQGILDKMKGTNTAWAQFGADPYSDATQTTPPSTVTIYVSCLDDIYKVDGNSYNSETLHNYKTYLANAEFNLYRLTTLASPGAGGILYNIGAPLTFTDDTLGSAIYDGDPANTNTFTTLTSDATGLINAYGLAPGLYMLHETVAPNGYNKLTYDVFFKIEFVNDPDIGWTFIKSVYFDSDEEHPFLYESAQPAFRVVYDLTREDTTDLDSENWIYNIEENVFIENFSGTLFPGTGGIGTAIFYAASLILTAALSAYVIATTRKRKTNPTV